MPSAERTFLVAASVIVAAALAGCGRAGTTPTPEPTASVIATASLGGGIPAGPADQQPSGGLHPANAPASAYLVAGEKVAPVARTVAMPAVARGAMLALLSGPTAAEKAAGYTSAIPAGTKLLGIAIDGDIAIVDLSGEFDDGGGTLSMSLRAAQVVHTLTQFANVERVRFRMDGQPLELLGGEGLEVAEPQTRAMWEDYAPAVLVEGPAAGSQVYAPLKVRGTANVFEAVFNLDVVAPDGTVLASKTVHATSGTGTRGTFSAVLDFTPWTSGTGTLVAWYDSPKDGSRVVVAEVPLEEAE